ncbi:MAG TPA: winged helix-turn-helix domain-containing protein, partial [Candidatus Acidoferrum sp.]|nr:winged helix-turn-helix domain-containing protein [Candidatus Acidoferrum sp.]
MTQTSQGRVRFGAFELDLKSGELYPIEGGQSDGKVLLREQSFQVLRMLVERAGEIVTRDEIKQRLWPDDTIVDFDHSINTVIKTLRRALGDTAEDPRYIETLARRGYRLRVTAEWLPTVVENVAEPASAPGPQPAGRKVQRQRKPWWWKAAPVVASAAILVVVYTSWRHFRDATPPGSQKVMLAVLPFANLTGDPNKEYLADGLTEETISLLGRLNPEQLGVIARTSVMGYKHKDVRLDQVGRDLSVQYVLENSVRESGDHLRLTAQLIQVKDQTHLWSQDYDYAAKDTLNVEDEVAKAVAREIRLRLTPQKQAELAQTHPVNPEAFEAYLQGYHFFQGSTDKDADMATKYFERATQLDPSYALAWAWLSRARNWQANQGLIPMEEGRGLAREAVERALSLNPNLAKAHIEMGRLKQQIDFDWVGADASFQRAISLEPGNPEGVRMAAWSAAMFGRLDEAVRLGRRAVDLDPLDEESWWSLGQIERLNGQLDQAAADGKKGLELDPDSAGVHILLSQIYLMQGRPQDALPEIERIHY